MSIEIERKFLVADDTWRRDGEPGRSFRQGHLARDGMVSVRVRRAEDRATLTVKGRRTGIARPEFEYDIPLDDADELLATLCTRPLVEKTRYRVPHAGMIWEVDVYEGHAAGVVVAEIELAESDQPIVLPPWIGEEVTGDPRYRNSSIARAPALALVTPEAHRRARAAA